VAANIFELSFLSDKPGIVSAIQFHINTDAANSHSLIVIET